MKKSLKLEMIDVGNEVDCVNVNKESVMGKHIIQNNVCVQTLQ